MDKIACPNCHEEHFATEKVCPFCGHVRQAPSQPAPAAEPWRRPPAPAAPAASSGALGTVAMVLVVIVAIAAGAALFLRDAGKKRDAQRIADLVTAQINDSLAGPEYDGHPVAKDVAATRSGGAKSTTWSWKGRLVGDEHLAGDVYGSYDEQTGKMEIAFNYSLNAIDPNSGSVNGTITVTRAK